MNDSAQIRKYITLLESRNPDLEYEDEKDTVIARLYSYESQSYTKLAQKLERISQLEDEIKALKNEVKIETKERIQDLFEAEDAAKTRVVETVSFIFTMTKDPKATVSPKYKEILQELEKSLTPELILVLNTLKETMITVTQKSPGLKVNVKEDQSESKLSKLKDMVLRWATTYDQKLDRLESMI